MTHQKGGEFVYGLKNLKFYTEGKANLTSTAVTVQSWTSILISLLLYLFIVF